MEIFKCKRCGDTFFRGMFHGDAPIFCDKCHKDIGKSTIMFSDDAIKWHLRANYAFTRWDDDAIDIWPTMS